MAEERKVQLGFAVDATGARQGFQEVKDASREMAQGVQQSAQQAGKAIDGMGTGGGQAAQKVDGAARSIIGSIQRTTATMQAGEKGTASYYEALAGQRGVNTDILRPYLEQLRQVEAAQKSATVALAGGSTSMEKMGVSTGQTNAALRQLPAQITDIVTSLQGGQKPLTVLIQQGGQIRDSFGGIGETFRALGGQAALLFPTLAAAMGGVAAQQQAVAEGAGAAAEGLGDVAAGANDAAEAAKNAGVALNGARVAAAGASSGLLIAGGVAAAVAVAMTAVVIAYRKGADESFAFDAALLKTGNIIGTTTGQLREMAQAIGEAGDFTEGAAAEALVALASSGKIAGDSLKNLTEIALDMDEYVGQAVGDTAKIFAELGNEPTKAVLKLNESLHFLTLTQLEQIKALEEHGDKTKAAQLAQEAYADAVKPTIAAYKANLDSLDVILNFWTDKGKKMWDALVGSGRQDTGQDRIAKLRTQLAQIEGPDPFKHVGIADAISATFDPSGTKNRLRAGLQEQITYLERVTQAAKENAGYEKERQRVQEAGLASTNAVTAAQAKGLTKLQQMNAALGTYRKQIADIRAANPESALLDAKKIAAGEKAIREQFKEKGGGGSGRSAAAGESELATMRAKTAAARDYLKALQANGLAADKQNEFEAQASRLQKELEGSIKGVARANKEKTLAEAQAGAEVQKAIDSKKELLKVQADFETARDKEAMAIAADIQKINDKTQALEDEAAAYGKTAVDLQALTIKRLEDKAAMLTSFDATASEAEIAAIREKIKALTLQGEAAAALEGTKLGGTTDETLRNAQEMARLYQSEASTAGLTATQRKLISEQRKIALEYAKKEADIDKSGADEASKAAARAKLAQSQQIEMAVAAAQAQDEAWGSMWASVDQTAHDVFVNVADEGMDAFKRIGKTLKSAVLDMLYQMTIKKWIFQIAGSMGGGAGGVAGAVSGGGGLMGGIQTASNISTLWGATSQAMYGASAGASMASLGYANAVGMMGGDAIGALAAANGMWAGVATGAQAAAQAAIGANLALEAGTAVALEAGTMATAAGTAGAAGGAAAGGLQTALAAIPGWGWALAAVVAVAALWDDGSGTPHGGAGAIYSDRGGLKGGADIYSRATFGMGMAEEYSKGGQDFASGIAKGLVTTLDGMAVAFGQKAGYEVAAAFADDTSKDGAWGALRISREGKDLLNWEGTRQSKWAPKEFADGEAGQKEYLAAIAKDTRQVLLDMDLPSWADTLLESIGEAASMEQLSQAVMQIGQIQTLFVQLGQTVDGFAGMGDKAFEALLKASGGADALAQNVGSFYENFYTEEERMAKATAQLTEELAKFGKPLPATKDAYRALFEEAVKAGEGGAALAAKLLQLNPAFAQVTDYAAQAAEAERALQEVRSAVAEQLGINTGATNSYIDALAAAAGGMDALQGKSASFYDKFFTDAEKTNHTIDTARAALASVGLEMPTTAQGARALMDAAVGLGEAGKGTVVAILNATDGIDAFVNGVKAVGTAVQTAVASWEQKADLGGLTVAVRGSWASLIAEIVSDTDAAKIELAKLTSPKSSYEIDVEAIQTKAADRTTAYWTPEQQQASYDLINVKRQQHSKLDFSAGYYASMGPEWEAMSQWARNSADAMAAEITALTDSIGKAPPEIQALIEAETALLDARNKQSADKTVAGLMKEVAQLDMSPLEKQLSDIAERADEYVAGLKDLGQGTDANIAAVAAWEAAMIEAAQSGGGAADDLRQSFADAYKSQLGRAPDTAGLEYWIGIVESGTATMETAMAAFSESATTEGLNNRILELTDAEGYLAQMRANELSLLSPANQLLKERIWALEEEGRIAQERTGLQDQLNGLTDTAAQALTRQRDALDESNRALFDQVQAATKAAQIEQERTGLQDQLNQLTLTSIDLRALEIAKLDEANRPLQERIWLLEEEKRIAEERNGLMTSLYQSLGNTGALRAEQLAKLDPANQALQQQIWQIEDAKTALEKALQAESESANAAQQAAQERVSTLQSIFDALKSNVDSLYESVEATKEWTAAQANAFIDNALANAKATGYMPEMDDLADAMAGARGGLDKQYATEFDRQRETLVLAGKLSDLQDIAGPQLTIAEKQLQAAKGQIESLDALQKQGRAMLDSLSGNVAATLSVRDAIAGLSAAILASQAAQAAQKAASTPSVASQLVTAYGAGNVTSGSNSHTVVSSPAGGASATRVLSADGKSVVLDVGSSWSQDQVADQIKSNLAAYATFTDKSKYDTLLKYAQENGIPGYASGGLHAGGLRIVGENGPELEATGPARIWNAQQLGGALGSGGNTARLEALVEGLTAEVHRLQGIVARGVEHQRETAEILDNVTEGGSAMRTEVMA